MSRTTPWRRERQRAVSRGGGIPTAEGRRLADDRTRAANWKRWGPYLSERQWATVREDYSADGSAWDSFPHDQARSRAYRWGEDGILGITDRQCRLCFAIALWNGKDSILKERLFGVTAHEGNHGEDVKEEYFYLDSTPTHSYLKGLYKYPQAAFPYSQLVEENRRRTREEREYELGDTGVFDEGRYFDVFAEYAKASQNDILIRITVRNCGPSAATLQLLPTLWFRNTWTWTGKAEDRDARPRMRRTADAAAVAVTHAELGSYRLDVAPLDGRAPELLFTENETNARRLWGLDGPSHYAKDAFHAHVVEGRHDVVNPDGEGTKAAARYELVLAPGEEKTVLLRLSCDAERDVGAPVEAFGPAFDAVFAARIAEADEFYAGVIPAGATTRERLVVRQGYAGLLWSKQFYHFVVNDWLAGDPWAAPPPTLRKQGRNREWRHLYAQDVLSMPDKWEYPWFAAWDLAFHMVAFADIDGDFAKSQLVLLLREWYLHPNGQIPAYEFAFGDVNPPVHAWAAWRVYQITGKERKDRDFLESVFQKLLLNFTWWVNRKDALGRNLFSGGFLGLDNIGVFDRSKPLPTGGTLEQADGTAWMAFYCLTMLDMALELADDDGRLHPAYEDMASKFLEHFVQIADSMNSLGGSGLWDDDDGFYYDQIRFDRHGVPLKTRSLVGMLPLIAVEVFDFSRAEKLPGFKKRLEWFLEHRKDLSQHFEGDGNAKGLRMLAIPSRERLERVVRCLLSETEFLSNYGIRSLSRHHEAHPFEFAVDGRAARVNYAPDESITPIFGGNSNWRGPVWFPINYLLIEALERYHYFYGDSLVVECPTGSGRHVSLLEASREIGRRLASLFMEGQDGHRPCHGTEARFVNDPYFRDLVLFYEYFNPETGRGMGASHQTGWTSLVVRLLNDAIRDR